MDLDKEFELLKEYMKYCIDCLVVCVGGFEYATSTYQELKDGTLVFIENNSYLTWGSQNITSFEDWKLNRK